MTYSRQVSGAITDVPPLQHLVFFLLCVAISRMLTSYFTQVYSGIVDLTLALIPWKLLWGLPIRKKEKFGAAVAMSMGVL